MSRPVEVEPSLYEGMAASIYDPNKPRGHQTICECREYADALRIAAALNAVQDAEGLRARLRQTASFLSEFSAADLDEIAADGGVTVGMVFQQQARDVFVPRANAALTREG